MQVSPVHQLVGQHVGSCYVERLLSRGRLNAVYLAQQPMHRRYVAITTFLVPEQLSTEARSRFIARFMKEAAILVTLKHPHILPIYEYGEQMGCPYLVTPYVTEGSLADVLNSQGRYTPDDALFVLEQTAVALEYAHNRGVVHGMLKSGYILLRQQQTVQVAGFGLVRMLELNGIEHSTHPHAHLLSIGGTLLGVPEYNTPEWIVGQPLSTRSDVYALGILLFELLNGSPPFTGTQPFEVMMQHVQHPLPSLCALRPDVPASVELVLNRALARNPAQRFSSPQELVIAFSDALKPGDISSWSVNTQTSRAYQEAMPVSQGLPATNASTRVRANEQPLTWSKTQAIHSRRSTRVKRRRVVALLASVGVAAGIVGVVGFEGSKLTHGIGNIFHPQAASSPVTKAASGQGTTDSTKKPMKPVANVGKMIGSANLATNTSTTFANPVDGKQSLLVHLPDGTFAAYESACTHQGVTVAYDPETHMLVCPAHGSIFDPAHGGSVVQGPAMQPLSQVVIHVNTDGSITTN